MLTIQLGLGIYGGYFGGAVGIMMMAVLIFIAAHAVRWREAGVLLVGGVVGAYCGALVGGGVPLHRWSGREHCALRVVSLCRFSPGRT